MILKSIQNNFVLQIKANSQIYQITKILNTIDTVL